jgi:hypothetical protein
VLKIRKVGQHQWHSVPLVTNGRSDYVKVRLHQPAVAGVSSFDCAALTEQTVSRIDLAKTMTGLSMFSLIHLRYGCPGRRVMEAILVFLKLSVKYPPEFFCPICMSEKTVSLSRGCTRRVLLLPIGARLQMDFGFYKVDSIRGFNCFLVIVEARTGNYWTYLRRSKHPPIELCLWFIRLARTVLGFSVAVIRTDGGGELWGSTAF